MSPVDVGDSTVAVIAHIETLTALPLEWRVGFGAFLGIIIGSFLATIAVRLPVGKGVTQGRSRCDQCGRILSWTELIPLLGYALRRGKCQSCGEGIDPIHPITEVAAALIGALSLAIYPGVEGVAGAIFGWLLLLLAVLDIRHFWLPDRLTLPLVLLGLASAWFMSVPPLIDAMFGAFAGFLLLYAINRLYRAIRGRDGLGGGDAKLLAGIGAWLGWTMLPFVLLLASVTGLCAVMVATMGGRRPQATDQLPFGAYLAVAAWPLWLAHDAFAMIFPAL